MSRKVGTIWKNYMTIAHFSSLSQRARGKSINTLLMCALPLAETVILWMTKSSNNKQ